jgi:hypothetical protein
LARTFPDAEDLSGESAKPQRESFETRQRFASLRLCVRKKSLSPNAPKTICLFRILNKFLKIPIATSASEIIVTLVLSHYLGFSPNCFDGCVEQIAAPALLKRNSGLQPYGSAFQALKKIELTIKNS